MSTVNKIENRVKSSKQLVFLRKDFSDIASYSRVGYSLKKLVEQEVLLKAGYGVYVKTRISKIDGRVIPVTNGGVDSIFIETINRLGIEWEFTGLTKKYLNGEAGQVPAGKEIKIKGNRRFQRKLSLEGMDFTPHF